MEDWLDRPMTSHKMMGPCSLILTSMVAPRLFISYSLWAASPALQGAARSWMLQDVRLVLVGIFR